jgi:hypothetical protein
LKGNTETEEPTNGAERDRTFQADGLKDNAETEEPTDGTAKSAQGLTENAGAPQSQNDPEAQPDPSPPTGGLLAARPTPANFQNDPETAEVRRQTRLMIR